MGAFPGSVELPAGPVCKRPQQLCVHRWLKELQSDFSDAEASGILAKLPARVDRPTAEAVVSGGKAAKRRLITSVAGRCQRQVVVAATPLNGCRYVGIAQRGIGIIVDL